MGWGTLSSATKRAVLGLQRRADVQESSAGAATLGRAADHEARSPRTTRAVWSRALGPRADIKPLIVAPLMSTL